MLVYYSCLLPENHDFIFVYVLVPPIRYFQLANTICFELVCCERMFIKRGKFKNTREESYNIQVLFIKKKYLNVITRKWLPQKSFICSNWRNYIDYINIYVYDRLLFLFKYY